MSSVSAMPDRMSGPRVATASLVGTTIEFYDFYVYGTAAALVIGSVFFPAASPSSQALNAFLTFGIAFLARPLGSALFGHFGDRIGRKTTLVASLLVMGISTTLIGFSSDRLVPLSDLCELQRRCGAPAPLHVIDSRYGHDAFLKEPDKIGPLIADALDIGSRA